MNMTCKEIYNILGFNAQENSILYIQVQAMYV